MAQPITFASVFESAMQLPGVHIDRTSFLTKNLSRLCTQTQLDKALTEGTLHSGIPITMLDSLANAVIRAETYKVTSISALAGVPGGFAMALTIPGDIAQFYGFVIRVAQELAYIYGWDELSTESIDADTESQLIIFIGVMSGVGVANGVVAKLFGVVAQKNVAKKVAAVALTKTWYYPLVKKIAAVLGQKMTKTVFARGVSKAVPVLGAAVSGGLTLAMFKPMAHRLKNHLSKMAHMSPEKFAQYEATIDIDAEVLEMDNEAEEIFIDEGASNSWTCVCATVNKGKFCTGCGEAKPASIPQYVCDKCGWEPDDKTHPPNYCPECGDPFDEGDIVLV